MMMPVELDILRAWPGIRPGSIAPIQHGSNNRTYRIGSAQGEYILQTMRDVTDRACLASQHRLLAALRDREPGFAVPAPVPAVDGSTIVAMNDGSGGFGVLTPVIPGSHPDGGSVEHMTAVGNALGALHLAFAQIPDPLHATCGRRVPSFTSPAGTQNELATMLDAPGFSDALRADLFRVIARSRTIADSMVPSSPVQIVHADFYPSNVLIEAGRVTGILDFEFAARGLRVYDVALALWAFVLWDVWQGTDDSAWDMVEPFLSAYASTVDLATNEWNSLADHIVIQEAHVLLHWCGRFSRGLASRNDLMPRAQRLVDMERWVDENRTRLEAQISRVV